MSDHGKGQVRVPEKRITVLLVEDNPSDVRLVKEMLAEAEHPFRLEAKGTLAGGIERLAKGGIDAVLLDLGLPDSTGYDTFTAVKATAPDVPVLVLTVLGGENLAVRAVREGAEDFLFKSELAYAGALTRAIKYAIERKKARQALQAEKQLSEFILDNSPAGIAFLDNDFVLRKANPAYDRLIEIYTPFTPKQARGMSYFDYAPGSRPQVERWFCHVRDTGETEARHAFELKLTKDGREVVTYWDTSVTAVKSPQGQVQGISILTQDVTERTRVEKSLAKREALLKEAQKMGRIGNWEFDPATGSIMWSDEVYELYERDRSLGPPTPDEEARCYPESQAERLRECTRLALEEGQEFEYDLLARLPSGRTVYFSATMTPVKDERGRVIKLFGTVQDVSERKRSERILASRLHLLEFATTHGLEELLQETLDELGALTDSPVGFYHFLKEDETTIELCAWSTKTLEVCSLPGENCPYQIDEAGVWADCVRERRPVIHNDYAALSHKKGLPAGHAPVTREMVVPILRRGKAVATVGMGNKPTDYHEKDIEVVSTLADLAWDITERKRMEEALREGENRYRSLFENSPVSLWEEDASAVKTYITKLKKRGVRHFRRYFEVHPDAAAECAGLVKIVDVNQATLDLYSARDKKEFVKGLASILGEESRRVFALELAALAEGRLEFEGEAVTQSLTGRKKNIFLRLVVAPGREGDWSRVLVSEVDMTASKAAEESVKRIQSALIVVKDAMETMLATESEQALLDCVCAHMTRIEDVVFVWVARKDPNSFDLKPMARAGLEQGFLSSVKLTWDESAWGTAPAAMAVKRAETQLVGDIRDEAGDTPWGQEALKRGYRSNVAVPLFCAGQAIGALSVYFGAVGGPGAEEVGLIEELVASLSAGIDRLRLDRQLRESIEKQKRWVSETIEAIGRISETRDPYTAGHQKRVAQLAAAMAGEMGFPDRKVEGVEVAALMHDAGKVAIPVEILDKPGELTKYESQLVMSHSDAGYKMLKDIEFPWPVAKAVRQVHERMDGSGYPDGLTGNQIMLEARIIAVADTVEAMASHRPYRPKWGLKKALKQLSDNKGVLYDPWVVDACLTVFRKGFKFEKAEPAHRAPEAA